MEQPMEMALLEPEQSTYVDDQKNSKAPSLGEGTDQQQCKQSWSWSSKVNDYWVWEALFCTGSLIALMAVIVLLRLYDGKSLPEWPYGITINSVLSWITQILTSCIVGAAAPCLSQSKWIHFSTGYRPLAEMDTYDWASRGPLGCAAFIWISRMKRSAAVGAIITILSIGVGPFVQQMATVRNQLVPSSIPASMPRAGSYQVMAQRTSNQEAMGWEINEESIAIYNAALGQSNTSARVKPDCPTGDCDIPPFRSLALCSHCSDVSHLLSSSSNPVPCYTDYSVFNHSLPTGLNLSYTNIPFFSTNSGSVSTGANIEGYRDEYLPPRSRSFWLNAVLNLTTIRVAGVANLSDATASHCSLYWCVKTYSGGVKGGQAYETVLDTYYEAEATYPVTFRLPAKTNLPAANFTVHDEGKGGLQRWLADKFEFRTGFDLSCIQGWGNSETLVSIESGPSTTEFTQPFISFKTPDLFARIADGLTAHVRTVQPSVESAKMAGGTRSSTEHALGKSWVMETQIHIRWVWITLPAFLVLLTITFLVMVVLQSKQRRLDLWKSSSLPLLYLPEMDQNIQQDMRLLGDPVQVGSLSKKIRAMLLKDDSTSDTWQLHSVDKLAH